MTITSVYKKITEPETKKQKHVLLKTEYDKQ